MEKAVIAGTWINEMGSLLRIDSYSPDGRIAGTFKPAKGSEVSTGKEHACVGFWHKDKKLLNFSCIFDHSIVTWMGYLPDDKTIITHWMMQKTNQWDGNMLGSNKFTRKEP